MIENAKLWYEWTKMVQPWGRSFLPPFCRCGRGDSRIARQYIRRLHGCLDDCLFARLSAPTNFLRVSCLVKSQTKNEPILARFLFVFTTQTSRLVRKPMQRFTDNKAGRRRRRPLRYYITFRIATSHRTIFPKNMHQNA